MDIPCAPILADITSTAADQGGRAADQAGVPLRLQPRDRRADLADRGAAGAARATCPASGTRRRSRSRPSRRPTTARASSIDDLIDFTPELRAEAESSWSRATGSGRSSRRPSVSQAEGPIAHADDGRAGGGTNWPGGSYDPETHIVYVRVAERAGARSGLVPPPPGASDMPYHQGTVLTGARTRRRLRVGHARDAATAAVRAAALTVQGLPLVKPPYGRITAIDLTTGEIRWQVPHGETPDNIRNHPALKGLDTPAHRPARATRRHAGDQDAGHRRRGRLRADAVGPARRDAARLRQGDRQGSRRGATCRRRRPGRR